MKIKHLQLKTVSVSYFTPGFEQKWDVLTEDIEQKFLLKKKAPILPEEVLGALTCDDLWFDHQLQMFRLH